MLDTQTTINQLCGDCLGETMRKSEGLYCENCGDYCEDTFFILEKNRPDLVFADKDDTVSINYVYTTQYDLELPFRITCLKADFLEIIQNNNICNGSWDEFFAEYTSDDSDAVYESLLSGGYDYIRKVEKSN